MKRFLIAVLSLLLLFSLSAVAFATENSGTGVGRAYVVDQADLLSPAEEAELASMAEEISQRQQCDVVIVTTSSTGSKSPQAYADDYFDYNGYGYGKDRSGILFLLSMVDRDWYMSARGMAMQAFPDATMDDIWNQCSSSISSGDYAKGFRTFLSASDTALQNYQAAQRTRLIKVSLLSVLIGFLVAFLFSGRLRAQLKSVRKKYNATNYKRENSMHLVRNRDVYLYTNTTYRVIETNRSSGGSSTHTSSSGATHSGRGGKF